MFNNKASRDVSARAQNPGRLNDAAAIKCFEYGIYPKCDLSKLEFSEDVGKYSRADCGAGFNAKGEFQLP